MYDDEWYDKDDDRDDDPAEPNCFTCYDAGGACCYPNRWQRAVRAPGRTWRDLRSWWLVRSGRITFDDEAPF